MIEWLYWHSWLLNDEPRMRAYRKAIHNAVRPGNVVLDVGTGSGIMAMFACQAGARRVYALDTEDIIVMARMLAKRNGFGDRIKFMRVDAATVKLREKVDVITSELITNNGPGEHMAKIIGRCRDRFLKPGGRIVPEAVDMCLAPSTDARAYRVTQLPDVSQYDIDFSPYFERSHNVPVQSYPSDEALLATGRSVYSYRAFTSRGAEADRFEASVRFDIEKEGTFHGYCSWFHAMLAEGVPLSNKPPAETSWPTVFFPLEKPVPVSPGMTVELVFRGRYHTKNNQGSDWDTTVRSGNQVIARYRQSSHFSDIRESRPQTG